MGRLETTAIPLRFLLTTGHFLAAVLVFYHKVRFPAATATAVVCFLSFRCLCVCSLCVLCVVASGVTARCSAVQCSAVCVVSAVGGVSDSLCVADCGDLLDAPVVRV